jgi:glycosyltransferase involved in cell wall biosynthesis
MKILHIIPHYLPSHNFGGSPISTRSMVSSLVKQGHEVDVLTTDVFSSTERNKILIEKVSSKHRIIRCRNISNWLAYTFKFHLAPGIFSFLWKHAHEYDVIHMHEYRTTLNVLAALLKGKTKAKFVLHAHGVYSNFGGREIFKDIFDFCFHKTIDSSLDQIIAISKKEFRILQKGFPLSKVQLLYHGLDTPIRSNKKFPQFANLPKKFILFVGRLHEVKRVDFLIKAYAESQLWKKDISLVIAGNDDGELVKLMKLVKKLHLEKHVVYVGTVNSTEKYQLYRNALLTSYVTYEEPFGNVPLEAASVGCWSIISKSSGVAELTTDFHFANVITGNNLKDFALHLKKLSAKRKRVSAFDQKELSKLSWKKHAQTLLGIYSQQNEDYASNNSYSIEVS